MEGQGKDVYPVDQKIHPSNHTLGTLGITPEGARMIYSKHRSQMRPEKHPEYP